MVDKDRIKGSAEQAKGKVKEWAGKATGDKKTEGQSRPGGRKSAERSRWSEGRPARQVSCTECNR